MTEDMRSPILTGKGASDYERYLRTDELLALQKPADEMLHPDELTFQVTHQASELLMKGAAWELDRARICILQGDYRNATRLLRRANKMLVHPLRMLALLETITPYEYHVIRAGLGHGSGLDSPGFLALLHIAPRLGEAFFDQVKNAGLTLEQLYYRHAEFFELHEIAEELLDYDEQIQLFRYAHLKLAQRIIGGGVVGTMGTPVEVLQKRMEFPLYRALWDVRNEITSKVNAEHATGHGGAY
jgi:tryptophan 2,3-dioxygenase